MNEPTVTSPLAKAASAVVAAGVAGLSWSEVAAMLAAFYTCLLISEWFWKKFLRPFSERQGWLLPRPRRIVLLDELDGRE